MAEDKKEKLREVLQFLIDDEKEAIEGYTDKMQFIEHQEIRDIVVHIIEEEANHIDLLTYCIDKYCK